MLPALSVDEAPYGEAIDGFALGDTARYATHVSLEALMGGRATSGHRRAG